MIWTLLARVASVIVFLEALLIGLMLLFIAVANDEETGHKLLDESDAMVLLAPLIAVDIAFLFAAVALWRRRLFGDGVGVTQAVLGVVSVGVVVLVNAYVLVRTADLLTVLATGLVVFGTVSAVRLSLTTKPASEPAAAHSA